MIYYLVDRDHPAYFSFIEDCREDLPKQHRLSVTENLTKTKSLIKVFFLLEDLPENLVIEKYTSENYREIYDFIYSSEWRVPDEI